MPTKPPAPTADRPQGDRIAKLLARAGIASRREVERMIADGRVARDGVAIDTPATILTSLHGITVDGKPVAAPAPARLFVYHKPPGLLVTERDPAGRPTIYDWLPAGLPRVVPVGRLDLATEGLLLLTTDGGLKRQLELPATGVERTYRARAYGPVTQAQLEELIHGIEIDGIRYGQIDANLERRTGANTWIELTLTEGKNREVRRVLEHLGLEVSRLIRTRYGPFVLGDLAPGEVGEVRQHDLVAFRRTLRGETKGADDLRVATQKLAPPPAATPEPGDGKTAQHRSPTRARPPRAATGERSPAGTAAGDRPRRATAGKPAADREATPASPRSDRAARWRGNRDPSASRDDAATATGRRGPATRSSGSGNAAPGAKPPGARTPRRPDGGGRPGGPSRPAGPRGRR